MQVFAHRGSSLDHPENTLEAFEAALAEGATGIETDLRLTRDGVLVLVHDPDLRRTGDDPRRVTGLTALELARVRLSGGGRVPLLADLWDLAAKRVRLNLELKGRGTGQALARFLAARAWDPAQVLVTSSRSAELAAVRAQCPGVPAGPVWSRLGERQRRSLSRSGFAAVSLAAEAFSEGALASCRSHGAELLLWVVNAPEGVLDLARSGVDGVFTDCPGRIRNALGPLASPRGRLVP
ncbi:MAG: glycerophosphodiester phosphodiesterase [Thermodesulfobacteriota bacterium]